MFNQTNREVKWVWRYSKTPQIGNVWVIYKEDVLLLSIFSFVLAFIAATTILWELNFSFFPVPPAPDFVSPSVAIYHVASWLKLIVNALPFHFYKQDAGHYYYMVKWLMEHNMLYILTARIYIALIAGCAGVWMAIKYKSKHPVPFEKTAHKRGMRVLEAQEAAYELNQTFARDLKRMGSLTTLAENVPFPTVRLLNHTFMVGASGTGKSLTMRPFIKAAVEAADAGVRTIILDPKYEWTEAFYDPNNPKHAILDPTDSRSVVPDYAADLRTIALKRKFANSYIPPGKGDEALWSNGATLQFVGYQIYAEAKFPDYTVTDISDLITYCNLEQSAFIFKNYFPDALDTIGQIDEQTGEVEANVTSYGMRMNLKGFVNGLTDLSRYWYNPQQRKISLYKFMTDPDYPIKVLFIKPNDAERLMSSGVIRSCLNYMISMMDQPAITNSDTLQGCFFLDEFQAPGALLTEDGDPTIDKLFDRGRSKGWAGWLAMQAQEQAAIVYDEATVKKWLGVTSNYILCGTSVGETSSAVSELIGKAYFDKVHSSYGYDPQTGKRKMGDESVQQHDEAVLLASEIASYLGPTGTHLRYLYMAARMKNVYILETPLVPLKAVQPAWVPQPEKQRSPMAQSRVMNALLAEIRGEMPSVHEPAVEDPPGVSAEDYEPDALSGEGDYPEEDFSQSQSESIDIEKEQAFKLYAEVRDTFVADEVELLDKAFARRSPIPISMKKRLQTMARWKPRYQQLYEYIDKL